MNTKSIAAVALLATVAAATETVTVTYTNVTFTTKCETDSATVTVPFNQTVCTKVCDVNSVSINATGYATYYADNTDCTGTTPAPVAVQVDCNSTAIIPTEVATQLELSDISCGNITVVTPSTSSDSQGSSAASVFVSFALVAASVVAALL